jgi:hypothetical protein
LATRLWAEVQALDAEIARLRHQDNPPASSEAGLADHEAVPLRSALVHFFKQFRQSVFAEYHGTGAEPYRERGFSDGCWFDTESARLLVALDQMPASSYETALADIVAWSEAYPKTVFLQPDYAKAHEALQAVGMTLDAISADIMRTALDEVGKRARSALGASDHPPASSGKALTGKAQGVERVRHVKRGTEYEVLGEAEAQISRSDSRITEHRDWLEQTAFLSEGDTLTVYRCVETGKLWCRFPDEFNDGRFVPAPPASSGQGGR